MTHKASLFKSILRGLGLALLCLTTLIPAHAQRKFRPDDYAWGSAPWKARYVIVISTRLDAKIKNAIEYNREQDEKNRAGQRSVESLVDGQFPLKDTPKANAFVNDANAGPAEYYKNFGYQILTFDRTGRVLTPNRAEGGLLARERASPYLTKEVVLVAGDGSPGHDWHHFAEWFEGFASGEGEELSPALCHWSIDDGRYSLSRSDRMMHPGSRYSVQKVAERIGLVGCREWTWQLRRPASLAGDGGQPPRADGSCNSGLPPEALPNGSKVCAGLAEHSHKDWQPYINVTTYIQPDKATLKKDPKAQPQTFIGDVLGWARFDDAPRPVIGKHGDYWLCLHECPEGDAPGIIPDIQAWTAKRGWPMPKPVSFFADSKFSTRFVD